MALDSSKVYSSQHLHSNLKIPKKYLQRLLTQLSGKRLIKSTHGRNGGFVFVKKIDKIFLSDIIEATEGFKKEPSCFLGFKKCPLDNPCALHEVWAGTQEEQIRILTTTRLMDLIKFDS